MAPSGVNDTPEQPDTAAIRASVEGVSHAYADLTRTLCNALDAVRVERDETREAGIILARSARVSYRVANEEKARADAAEARIAAYLAQVIERDDRIAAGLNVCDDMDANGNSRELGDPTAAVWHKAAQLVRRALTEGTGQ